MLLREAERIDKKQTNVSNRKSSWSLYGYL